MANKVRFVYIADNYNSLLYLVDNRVRLKKGRPYLALTVKIDEKLYAIPLTSQTTEERKKV